MNATGVIGRRVRGELKRPGHPCQASAKVPRGDEEQGYGVDEWSLDSYAALTAKLPASPSRPCISVDAN